MRMKIYALATLVVLCAPLAGVAATIQAGDVIKLDFGTAGDGSTAGAWNSDWNQVDTGLNTGGIGAGSVIRHGGGIIDGATISFSNLNTVSFADDSNANDWGGTANDPYYVLGADDIYFHNTSDAFSVAFGGLSDALRYSVRVYGLIGNGDTTEDMIAVTHAGGTATTTNTRGTRWGAATLEAGGTVFSNLTPDANNVLSVSMQRVTAGHLAFPLNAIVIEAHEFAPVTGDVLYSQNFEDGTASGNRALQDFGWRGVNTFPSEQTTRTEGTSYITASTALQGNRHTHQAAGSNYTQWLWTDSGEVNFNSNYLEDLTVSFIHQDSLSTGTGQGYRIGLEVDGQWYLQDDLILASASLTTETLDIESLDFIQWTGAPGDDTTTFNVPALGGGMALPEGLVTSLGMMLVKSNTTDSGDLQAQVFRFDAITISATPIPEPSTYALGLLGAVGVGLLLRRRRNR